MKLYENEEFLLKFRTKLFLKDTSYSNRVRITVQGVHIVVTQFQSLTRADAYCLFCTLVFPTSFNILKSTIFLPIFEISTALFTMRNLISAAALNRPFTIDELQMACDGFLE